MGVDQLVTGGDVDDPVVDSLTSESVNAGSVGIGDSDPVTAGPVGDEGEFKEIMTVAADVSGLSTTSTTWTNMGNPTRRAVIDYTKVDLTNIDSLYLSFAVKLNNDTAGEDVSARLRDTGEGGLPDTEVTEQDPNYTDVASPRGGFESSVVEDIGMQMEMTGGTGSFESPAYITLWGKIA